jgi:serine/threonine protein kinase
MFVGHPPFISSKADRDSKKSEIYEKITNTEPDCTLNEDLNKNHFAKSFIQMCLSKNKEHRWQTNDLLEHPWFKTVFEEANEAYKDDYGWMLQLIEHMKRVEKGKIEFYEA